MSSSVTTGAPELCKGRSRLHVRPKISYGCVSRLHLLRIELRTSRLLNGCSTNGAPDASCDVPKGQILRVKTCILRCRSALLTCRVLGSGIHEDDLMPITSVDVQGQTLPLRLRVSTVLSSVVTSSCDATAVSRETK